MKLKYTVRKENENRFKGVPIEAFCGYQHEILKDRERKTINPKMMTVKEVAATGVLSEYALRRLIKEGRLSVLRVGNRALINYERLVEDLNALSLDKSIWLRNPEGNYQQDGAYQVCVKSRDTTVIRISDEKLS